MASQFWSWIFIFHTLLIRSVYAYDYEVLARRALNTVFVRNLTEEQKTRNTYVALAIAAGVVLLAIFVGIVLLYIRHTVVTPDPEAGAVEAKPHWWMVEDKKEKMDWWRLSHRIAPSPVQSPQSDSGRSRIDRLKDALNIQRKAKNQAPLLPVHLAIPPVTDVKVPVQSDIDVQPRYPESLERGYGTPTYPAQIPTLTITPSLPARAIVTQGQRDTLSRSLARSGAPRSPASRRWLQRKSFRHPFLPLKDTDAALPKISAPVLINVDPSNPKLNYAISIKEPRRAPAPPASTQNLAVPVPTKMGMRKPAPLQLENPFGKARLGLPASPRPSRVSPAF